MKHPLLLISILIVSLQSFAGLELRSARCLSKDLTLNLAMVSNQQDPETTVPNAKAALVFKAQTPMGKKLLNGKSQRIEKASMAIEYWPAGNYLVSYNKQATINLMMNTNDDVQMELKSSQPLLYFYKGNSGVLNGQVSYVSGKRVDWFTCQIDEEGAADVPGKKTLADYPTENLTKLATTLSNCPLDIASENKLILDKGPAAQKGKMDICLQQIVSRELSRQGRSFNSATHEEIKQVISDLMEAAMKAQVSEQEGVQ